jgi:hypothetical protein
MTPEARASEIVSHWSKTWMDPAAKPTIAMQIQKAIEQDRAAMGLKILDAIEADDRIGIKSKELVVTLVMEALGIKEAELV